MPTIHTTGVRRTPIQPAKVFLLGFVALIAVGTVLLSLPIARVDGGIHVMDALFTATSAVCVTGLVVVDTAQAHTTFGELVILALIQIGGLGYMTAATAIALFIGRQVSIRERVLLREAYGQFSLRGVVWLARQTLWFTLIVQTVGALILVARFSTVPEFTFREIFYFGIFHSVSGFCNAGFDLMGTHYGEFASLTAFAGDPVVTLTIAGLFIIGGLGFAVVTEIYGFRWSGRISLHTKLVIGATIGLLVIGALFILLLEWNNPNTLGEMNTGDRVLNSFFHSATTRTAGFSTLDTGDMGSATLASIAGLMFIGASPGGTGGGIKTTTFILIILAIWSVVRGKRDTEVFSRRIPTQNILRALTIAALSLLVVSAFILALTITEFATVEAAGLPVDPFVAIVFEGVSAFGTVGLSAGITPLLSPVGQLLIIMLMIVGRVGPLTAMAALVSEEPPAKGRLPEEHVAIG